MRDWFPGAEKVGGANTGAGDAIGTNVEGGGSSVPDESLVGMGGGDI
jgi:hypothetical protein